MLKYKVIMSKKKDPWGASATHSKGFLQAFRKLESYYPIQTFGETHLNCEQFILVGRPKLQQVFESFFIKYFFLEKAKKQVFIRQIITKNYISFPFIGEYLLSTGHILYHSANLKFLIERGESLFLFAPKLTEFSKIIYLSVLKKCPIIPISIAYSNPYRIFGRFFPQNIELSFGKQIDLFSLSEGILNKKNIKRSNQIINAEINKLELQHREDFEKRAF